MMRSRIAAHEPEHREFCDRFRLAANAGRESERASFAQRAEGRAKTIGWAIRVAADARSRTPVDFTAPSD